jgi:hypothetical protein
VVLFVSEVEGGQALRGGRHEQSAEGGGGRQRKEDRPPLLGDENEGGMELSVTQHSLASSLQALMVTLPKLA